MQARCKGGPGTGVERMMPLSPRPHLAPPTTPKATGWHQLWASVEATPHSAVFHPTQVTKARASFGPWLGNLPWKIFQIGPQTVLH